ncbi:hypothetical protein C8J56DRAFT_356683 [Mycena floridula]|nr:hypothetical protein C8J56DRAFT_356683 [Mycena floridula]
MLLDLISSTSIPSDPSTSDMLLPYHCFFGLMCGLRVDCKNPRKKPTIFNQPSASQVTRARRLMEGHWSSIWSWIVFFAKHFGPACPISFIPPEQHIPLHEIITSLISNLTIKCRPLRLETIVTSSPGYLEIVIPLWLRSVADVGIALEQPAVTCSMVVSIGNECMIGVFSANEGVVEALSSFPNGPAILLSAVLIALEPRNILVGELRAPLQFLNACCHGPPQPIRQQLLLLGSIPILTRTLAKISSPKTPPFGDPFSFVELFVLGITHLACLFQRPNDRESDRRWTEDPFETLPQKPWMIQAFNGGMLGSIVKASHKISCTCGASRVEGTGEKDRRGFAQAVINLLDMVTYFSTDERIVRAIRGEMRRIGARRLNIIYAAKDGKPCPLWDAWVDFERQMKLPLQVRGSFYEQPQQICSNSSCLEKTTMESVKRCSGCRLAYYCSLACQKRDWQDGHKEVCHENPLCYPGVPPLQSALDAAFHRYIRNTM